MRIEMKRKALALIALSSMIMGTTGCSMMEIKKIDNSAYNSVASYDYTSMRDTVETFNPIVEKEVVDRGVYKEHIKDEALQYDPYYKLDDSKTDTHVLEDFEDDDWKLVTLSTGEVITMAEYKKRQEAEKKNSSSGSSSSSSGSSSSSSGSSSSGSSNSSTAETNPANGTTIIAVNGSNSSSSSSSSSSSNKESTPAERQNPASVVLNGTKYTVYVNVDGYYRGNKALRKINSYNIKHAVEYDTDILNGHELCIVNFTITAGTNVPSTKSTMIPDIRVRDSRGDDFDDEFPTYVHVMRLGNYKDDGNDTKSYDAVFEIPSDADGFQMIFGASSGNTYRFKSSSMDSKYDLDED